MAKDQRIVVLGGGVIGTTTAYYLALRGFPVTVLERRDEVGLETSFANGGLLTPSMADPWAAPGMPLKILKWLGREDSPFLLRLGALPGLVNWGREFLRNCNEASWRRNTEAISRLGEYSQFSMRRLVDQTAISFNRRRVGTLRLFRDQASMDSAKRGAAAVGALGIRYKLLSADDCAELEPALAPELAKISGGIHFPDDESGDAFKFTQEVARLCRGLPVEFRFGVTIEGFESEGDRITGLHTNEGTLVGAGYVAALGHGTAGLLKPLGIDLPIYPVKGYSVTLSTRGWNGAPKVPLLDDGRKIGIVPMGDRLRVAGTAEFTGPDARLNPRRGRNLMNSLSELFPGFPGRTEAKHWAGLRPMTPDGVPFVGATPYQNLYLNCGQGHLGWTLSCGSAALLADLMAGRRPEIDAAPLSLERP